MEIPHGGIAFFDSGIGGLTVLNECRKGIRNEIFYYYGDNAHTPYGNLSEENILSYVEQAFAHFCALQVKAVVLACNTATAVCVEYLRKKYPFPIIGAEPALFPAAKKGGRVSVLSTCATASSARFARLLSRAKTCFPSVCFSTIPCPRLAGEIERRIGESSYDFSPLFPRAEGDAIVLGCTHYIYVKNQIENFYKRPVFDGNFGIAKRLSWTLESLEKTVFEQNYRDERPLLTTARPPKIYFIGGEKERNCRVFEQMFGFC